MKLFILACFVVCAQASYVAHAPAALSTGHSTSSRTQDAAGNYAFAYNEQHSTGGSSRQESGNGWGAQGSYSLNVGDGRKRTVTYVADGTGFRAAISTNEQGTAAQPAADTSISSPYLPPQPVKALPVPVAVAEPAPVAQWAVAAPEPVALAPVAIAPVVKAIAPAVSSYSTSINHVAPAAEPVAVPVLSGWGQAPPPPPPAPIAVTKHWGPVALPPPPPPPAPIAVPNHWGGQVQLKAWA